MPKISFYHATLFLYLLLHVSSISSTHSLKGFSTKFIHRDSPASPFYDSSISQSDRMAGAIRRSMSRVSHLKLALNLTSNVVKQNTYLTTKIVPSTGEYLMEVFIGTPPLKQLAIADTGSDITWTQCTPCVNCFHQNQPFSDSKKSSTFRPIPCSSSLCEALDVSHKCSKRNKNCEYRLYYGDQSTSTGVLAFETYSFEGISIPNLVYGCSQDSQGTFKPDATGIIGLGGGTFSLVNQLGKPYGGKFSYCLTSNRSSNVSNNINFGSNAVVSGPGVVSTPLVKKSPPITFYYLTLEAMSVEHKKIRFPFNVLDDIVEKGNKGNIIIDSGTTLTFLPSQMYGDLENALKRVIHDTPVPDPEGHLNLCYNNNKRFKAPRITAHFAGGADLELSPKSTFILNGNLLCLAIIPNDQQPIYGNLAQMDFLIGYDLKHGTVSFKPTDCSKV